jgi:hypothetical protein
MSTHINEEACLLNDLIDESRNDIIDEDTQIDVKEFLSKFYTWDDDLEEFDDTPKPTYRNYEIKVKREDECCDDDFINIYSIIVSLPSDKAAKELADLLDGKVVSGLNKDGQDFCITYTKTVCIKAKSQTAAKRIFADMDIRDADRLSKFGKVVDVKVTVKKKAKK